MCGGSERDMKELGGYLEMSCIMLWVVTTRLSAIAKTHQTEPLLLVYFIIRKLYLKIYIVKLLIIFPKSHPKEMNGELVKGVYTKIF